MYKITDYTMKKADKLGLMVKPSTKKNKKNRCIHKRQ